MLLDNQSGLIGELLASLEKPEFCDIKIKSSDGEIQANKAILSIRSEYFNRMFSPTSNFVESSSGLCTLPYPKRVVKKVIIYLYTGKLEVDDLAIGSLLDMLELFNMINLPEEFQKVESYTVDKIKNGPPVLHKDCLMNLDKCSQMGMETVGETMVAYLRNNMESWASEAYAAAYELPIATISICSIIDLRVDFAHYERLRRLQNLQNLQSVREMREYGREVRFDEAVCGLSETMIIKLLEVRPGEDDIESKVKFEKFLEIDYDDGEDSGSDDPDYDPDNDDDKEESDYEEEEDTDYDTDLEEEEEDGEDEEDEEEEIQTIFRFKAFVTWLKSNPIDAAKKDKVLETFKFEAFSMEELTSVVKKSGLYSSEKIIERMGEMYKELDNRNGAIEDHLGDVIEDLKEELRSGTRVE